LYFTVRFQLGVFLTVFPHLSVESSFRFIAASSASGVLVHCVPGDDDGLVGVQQLTFTHARIS
jgi:hypothetical protein